MLNSIHSLAIHAFRVQESRDHVEGTISLGVDITVFWN